MSFELYALYFEQGYWREPSWRAIPAKSGIYCVYACSYDVHTNLVRLNRVLYIGESQDVQNRVPEDSSIRRDVWNRQLWAGEELCVNFAQISNNKARERAEAAMIFHHQPICNTQYIEDFPFDATTIETGGENALLTREFTVYRT